MKVKVPLLDKDIENLIRVLQGFLEPDSLSFQFGMSVDPSKVKVKQDSKEIPFTFEKFNITLKRYKTGKTVLYFGDEEVKF